MSGFLNLNLLDLGKGVLVAFLSAFLTAAYQGFSAGHFPTGAELTAAAAAGVAAGIAYLLKNLFTNSSGKILTPEQK